MAFENKELSVIAYANGFSWWHYKSPDSIETVLQDDYFAKTQVQSATNLIENGDFIHITVGNDLYTRCFYIENGVVKLKKTK